MALALAALLGAYASLSTVRWQAAAAGLAGASVAALGVSLWTRRAVGIPPAILLAGVAYGVSVAGRDPAFDRPSLVVAVLLLVAAELAFWSLELAAPIGYEPRILRRRLTLVTALALGSLGAAGIAAAAAAQDAERSLLLEGLGVAAAVAVVTVLARLARAR
jgi:hypothetical protein